MKLFMIHWGWSRIGKADCSRFPAVEVGMKLEALALRSSRRVVDLLFKQFVALGGEALELAGGAHSHGFWSKATRMRWKVRRGRTV